MAATLASIGPFVVWVLFGLFVLIVVGGGLSIGDRLSGKPPSSRITGDVKVCPDCAEKVKAAAKVCRFCGYRFG